MEVVLASPDTLTRLVADAVESLLRAEPAAVLGLATGSSPLAVCAELVRRHREEGVSFARTRAFTLPEHVRLAASHPERYRNVVEAQLASQVDFSPGMFQGPDGLAENLSAACGAWKAAIVEAGGVDLQILGIGTDGHIAFNEPGSSLASRTHLKTLTPQTRRDNTHFFDGDLDEVPTHCLTQGLGPIMGGRHVVLLAPGRGKADVVQQLSRDRSARYGRRRSCSLTRTRPSWWTTTRPAGCSAPTTAGRSSQPSPRGSTSDGERCIGGVRLALRKPRNELKFRGRTLISACANEGLCDPRGDWDRRVDPLLIRE